MLKGTANVLPTIEAVTFRRCDPATGASRVATALFA
jgi:hypothetical protein